LRPGMVLGCSFWFQASAGLAGAVLVTLLSTVTVRVIGIARIASLFGVGIAAVLPWKDLAKTAVYALVAAAPAVWVGEVTSLPRLLVLMLAGATYAATYFALCYGIGGETVKRAPEP